MSKLPKVPMPTEEFLRRATPRDINAMCCLLERIDRLTVALPFPNAAKRPPPE